MGFLIISPDMVHSLRSYQRKEPCVAIRKDTGRLLFNKACAPLGFVGGADFIIAWDENAGKLGFKCKGLTPAEKPRAWKLGKDGKRTSSIALKALCRQFGIDISRTQRCAPVQDSATGFVVITVAKCKPVKDGEA